jgi:CBS domain containing-hemolysin-like protein
LPREIDNSLVMRLLVDYATTFLANCLVDWLVGWLNGWVVGLLVTSFWAFAAAQLKCLFFRKIAPRQWVIGGRRFEKVSSSSRVVCPIYHWTFDQSPRNFVSLSESCRWKMSNIRVSC